jgi:thioredoxin-related protein
MFESVKNLRLAEGLGVEETPTVKLFQKSKEIGEIVGFKRLEAATEEIKKIVKKSN